MQLSDKLMKPIRETAYLTADNVKRYRVILRYFYIQYEKIKYWMEQEEIYMQIISHKEFEDYTVEQCKQDLDSLVGWGNLLTIQDTKKVTSIEAFKNRKYRYQLSEYTVEIERMTMRLEHLFVEGASLEPTLLEKIKLEIKKLPLQVGASAQDVYSWWNNLNSDFIRLNQNYQDYMRDLNSAKAEELMKTAEFILYKDKLIEYLRSFVKGLQINVSAIEDLLKKVSDSEMEYIIQKVVEYEMSIPRLDTEAKEELIRDKVKGRFISLKEWFVDHNGRPSEAIHLFDMTNESIRKITRYAALISELFSGGANRKEDYRKLSTMFLACKDMKEAHCLSAVVFGVESPIHLKGEWKRATESINTGVYEEEAFHIELVPRIRNYREKAERSYIREHTKEKEEARKSAIEQMEKEAEMMKSFIKDGQIAFAELPLIEPAARNILLRWLLRALEDDGTGKTEDGQTFRIRNSKVKETCIVSCSDGAFEMPCFIMEFEEKEG